MINRTTTQEENFLAFMCHLSPIIPLIPFFILWLGGLATPIGYDLLRLTIYSLHFLLFSRLIFPLVGWMIGVNEKIAWIVHHAKSALNFQITYSFLFYIPIIIGQRMFDDFVGDAGDLDGGGWALAAFPFIIMFGFVEVILLLLHVILVFIASMIALSGIKNVEQKSRLIYPKTYPLVIPFFRTKNPGDEKEKNTLM
jgi:uncharacterized Tic20 family protein